MSRSPERERPGEPDDSSPVLVQRVAGVCWLRLNRPHRRNALTPELIAALDAAIEQAAADEATAVIVIAGEGASFCAGADLRYLLTLVENGEDPFAFIAAISACFTRIERAPKPVVAAVHGHVVAGGMELALACDVVIAAAGTLLGDGHVINGLLPGAGGGVRLPRKVGEPMARWLSLSGELLPAEAFLPSGFVHAVAPPKHFEHTVNTVVARLVGCQGRAQARMKELLGRWHEGATEQALEQELATFAEHWREADIATALQQFVHRKDDARSA